MGHDRGSPFDRLSVTKWAAAKSGPQIYAMVHRL
jgi:hypothetical protein